MPVPLRRTVGLVALLFLVLAAAFVACGGDDSDEPAAVVTVTSGPRTTEMRNNKFESPMKVTTGSTVTWVNAESVAHNVIAKDGSFKSETLNRDDEFAHTFATAGEFEYTCAFHPGMDGVIEVE